MQIVILVVIQRMIIQKDLSILGLVKPLQQPDYGAFSGVSWTYQSSDLSQL